MTAHTDSPKLALPSAIFIPMIDAGPEGNLGTYGPRAAGEGLYTLIVKVNMILKSFCLSWPKCVGDGTFGHTLAHVSHGIARWDPHLSLQFPEGNLRRYWRAWRRP